MTEQTPASQMIASRAAEDEVNKLDVATVARIRFNDWFWSKQLPGIETFLATREGKSSIQHMHARLEFWQSVREVRKAINVPLTQGQFDTITVYNMLLPVTDRNLELLSSIFEMDRYSDALLIIETKLRVRYTGTPIFPAIMEVLRCWYSNPQ